MLLVLAAGSIVVSAILTALVRTFALRHNVMDSPNARSSHTAPTPRGGGISVLATIGIALLAGGILGLAAWDDVVTLGVGMAALGIVGWMDDRRGVPASWRLSAHAVAASWTLVRMGGLPAITVGDSAFQLGAFGYVLGILGIVWSINLFNFMDGIDGLAGSQSLLIFGTASVALWLRGDHSLSLIAAIIAAASTGFLVWNWPPAKIFLGDAGSGAIGYLISAIALASENRGAMPVIAFGILGGVFVADATVTLLRRIGKGHGAAEAHRDHAYQRLARAWASHAAVTVGAAIVTVFLAATAMLATTSPALLVPGLFVAALLLAVLLFAAERRVPMRSADSAIRPST